MSISVRGSRIIAQGSLTNSKHPNRFSEFVPTHITEGHGEYLYDVDGYKWLDFICGLGTAHFGYSHEKIVKEQLKHAYKGASHSLPTEWEVLASEKLLELYPWVERVKWVNDGSSACTAACEIARAFTVQQKGYILVDGYHGWHPEQINPVSWNMHPNDFKICELDSWCADFENVAAIMIEPVQLDDSPERIEWLKNLRKQCDETGTILIYDEVITGLRYPKFGVCNNFGIKPDLLLLGKAMANGDKIACVAGRADLLDSQYFVSGTYHGHLPSLVTAHACMHLAKHDNEFDLVKLNEDSLEFIKNLNSLADGLFTVKGWGCRAAFDGDYELFHQEMAKAKVLFGPSLFLNFANIKHVKEVLIASERIIDRIRKGKVKLIGKSTTPAFSAKSRGS